MKAKRSATPVYAAAIDLGATSGRVILGRYARLVGPASAGAILDGGGEEPR